jgi:N-acetylated-alpha-linked acidic dipeptidase
LVDNRLGSGSDYTVFLNFAGVPIADLSFDGPYGVYHSIYDNHRWVARIGDPGFRYHAALVQLWGIMTLRLAAADALPLDLAPYAGRIREFAVEIERRIPAVFGASDRRQAAERAIADVLVAARQLHAAADALNVRRDDALRRADREALETLNQQIRGFERALLHEEGIPGRPWYRHLIYAPKYTYAPEILPGLAAALDQSSERTFTEQADRLATTLRRAAGVLAPR